MLRPSPNHGTQRLPNDDDDDDESYQFAFSHDLLSMMVKSYLRFE